MIGECAAELARDLAPGSRVGLLATTGTVESGLYHRALAERGLEGRSLLDLPRGEELQRRLVMEPIYGPYQDGRHAGGGIKSGGSAAEARTLLLRAAETLVSELGCRALVAGCTEIPLALPDAEVANVPLVDSVDVLARVAVTRAYGLPS